MAVIRVNKTKDYTTISNNCFKNKEMSLKAKGLLSLMLSLPDDWDYSISGLVSLSKDGKDSVMNALTELEKYGYLKRTRITNAKGKFAGYDYDIYEKPFIENPNTEKPNTEKPNTEKPNTEKPTQLNTNISNTKELNTKKNKKKNSFSFILESYSTDEEVLSLLNDWLDNRKSKHLAMTEHSIKLNLNKLDKMASDSNMSVKDYLTEVVCRGWGSFFVINNYGNNQAKNKNDGWCFNPDEEDDLDFIK